MRRLHNQFYLAILATIGIFALAVTLFWSLGGRTRGDEWSAQAASHLAESLLPAASVAGEDRQRALDDLRTRLRMDLALYDAEGHLLSASGRLPPIDARSLAKRGWTLAQGGPLWIMPLDDGRRLVVRPQRPPHHPDGHVIWLPLSIVIALALGAYPIARRLTRRLERLKAGVEQFGTGALGTRVPVEGHDEVAALAGSFNAAAGRIEELVGSHKLLLANCSHELRTPLARIRLGLERLSAAAAPSVHEEIARSIAELDRLIEEMLLAGRLDATRSLDRTEEIDLLALAAEEAAHFDCVAEGRSVTVNGDPALLRRLVRNLLDNAMRHAGGATRVSCAREDERTVLLVEDRGAGVPAPDRERIFEPFFRSSGGGASGYGLGLALVRQIARAHGGDVRYEPAESGGSRFVVTLPALA